MRRNSSYYDFVLKFLSFLCERDGKEVSKGSEGSRVYEARANPTMP